MTTTFEDAVRALVHLYNSDWDSRRGIRPTIRRLLYAVAHQIGRLADWIDPWR